MLNNIITIKAVTHIIPDSNKQKHYDRYVKNDGMKLIQVFREPKIAHPVFRSVWQTA